MQSPTIIGKLTLGEKLQVFKPALSARAGVVGGWKKRLEKDKSLENVLENVLEKFEVVVTVLFP